MLFMTVIIINTYIAQESCERKVMEVKIKRHGCVSINVNIGYCSGYCMSASLIASIPRNYTRACIPIVNKIKKKKGLLMCVRNNRVFSQFVEYLDIKDCRCQDVQVISQSRSSRPEVLSKKGVLGNFAKLTGKHLCQSLFLNKASGLACNFFKKDALAQVFSCNCKFWEIF